MGPHAESLGASLFGVKPDFSLPALPDLAPPEVRVEVAPGLPIPDAQRQGVTSVLWVPQTGRIVQMTVSLEVEHPFVGDLHVSLTGPDGTTAVLHDRTGGSDDDLLDSYSTEETPALADFVGSEGHGEWTLKVADLAGLDVGKLRRWGIEIDLEEGLTRAAPATADAHAPSVTDDLTLIKGIGPVIGHSLTEAGISTFEQLAACSPDELVARLGEASNVTADRIAKQGWIEEARQLTSERGAAPAPLTAGPVSAPERQHYATFMVELLLDEQNEVRRTRVVHIQEQNGTGRGENTWAGWEGGNLLGYFVEHAALHDETASLAAEDLALNVEAAFEEVSADRGARRALRAHRGRGHVSVVGPGGRSGRIRPGPVLRPCPRVRPGDAAIHRAGWKPGAAPPRDLGVPGGGRVRRPRGRALSAARDRPPIRLRLARRDRRTEAEGGCVSAVRSVDRCVRRRTARS